MCARTSRLTVSELREAAKIFRLLAHPQRLDIMQCIEREGRVPVHKLSRELGLPQPLVSTHLARLRCCGLVVGERQGREVRYRVGDRRVLDVLQCMRRAKEKR